MAPRTTKNSPAADSTQPISGPTGATTASAGAVAAPAGAVKPDNAPTSAKAASTQDDDFLSEDDGDWSGDMLDWDQMELLAERKWHTFSTSRYFPSVLKQIGCVTHMCPDSLLKCLRPRHLQYLSKLRAKKESSSVEIPCKWGWPKGSGGRLVVPVKFRDGLRWVLKLEDSDMVVMEDYDRYFLMHQRMATHCYLGRTLGSIVPKIHEHYLNTSDPFGFPYMVLEYCEGVPLDSVLKKYRDPTTLKSAAKGCEGRIIGCLSHLAELTVKLSKTHYPKIGFMDYEDCLIHPIIRGLEDTVGHVSMAYDSYAEELDFLAEYGVAEFGNTRRSAPTVLKDSEREIILELLKYAGRQQGDEINTFVPALAFDTTDDLVKAKTGRLAGKFAIRPVEVCPKFLSVYSYPAFLWTDWVEREHTGVNFDKPYIADEELRRLEGRKRLTEEKNALGQSLLESIAYFQSVWRVCIRHYETSSGKLNLGEIRTRAGARLFSDGLTKSHCFTSEQLINIIDRNDKMTWNNMVSVFVKHEKAAQSSAGIGPHEPDTSKLEFFLMHFDELFYFKSEPRIDAGDPTSAGDAAVNGNDDDGTSP